MIAPPLLEMTMVHFLWAKQVFLSEQPEINTLIFPQGVTREEWVTSYLLWSVHHGFLHTFGTPEPEALILIRPLDLAKLDHYRAHYIETIFEFDQDGDVTYVDFCYAPGNYPFIIKFLKSCGTEFIAWTHSRTGKLYIKPASDMPNNGMGGFTHNL